nr:hypothetical protein FVER53263_20249 [Fusarium verticillioides]
MSRRSLGVNDGPVAAAMNAIFDQDRLDEAAYEARVEAPETLKRARETIAMKYRDLVISAAQRATSNAGSSAHIAAQRGHQSLPPTAANPSYPVHTAPASSPPLPSHFDAFAVRPSVGDPRLATVSAGSRDHDGRITSTSKLILQHRRLISPLSTSLPSYHSIHCPGHQALGRSRYYQTADLLSRLTTLLSFHRMAHHEQLFYRQTILYCNDEQPPLHIHPRRFLPLTGHTPKTKHRNTSSQERRKSRVQFRR